MDEQGKTCGMKKCCPVKGFILPAIAVFAVIFVFQGLWHGVLMKSMYMATAPVWRPQAQMEHFCWIAVVRDLVTALIVTCLYGMVCKCSDMMVVPPEGKKCCPMSRAMKFGVKIGVLIGVVSAGFYPYLPIPKEIAIGWFAGDFVMGLLIGLTFCFIDRLKGNKSPA